MPWSLLIWTQVSDRQRVIAAGGGRHTRDRPRERGGVDDAGLGGQFREFRVFGLRLGGQRRREHLNTVAADGDTRLRHVQFRRGVLPALRQALDRSGQLSAVHEGAGVGRDVENVVGPAGTALARKRGGVGVAAVGAFVPAALRSSPVTVTRADVS